MSFLTINGLELKLTEASQEPFRVGEQIARSYSGFGRKSALAKKREWTATTGPLTAAEAMAWRSLIDGEGFCWTWDTDLYATNGLGPTAGYTATGSGSGGVGGSGYVSTGASALSYATQLPSSYTLGVYKWSGSAWVHYQVTSGVAGAYTDGVYSAGTSTSWVTVSSGSVSLGASNAFDHLVVYPFAWPSSWPTLYSVAAQSPLPYLYASGDLVNTTGSLTVLGEVTGSESVSFYSAGTWVSAGEILSVKLAEV